jgi:Flp pilus assembly protein TadD
MGIGSFNKLFDRIGSRGKDAQAVYERGAAAMRAGAIDDGRTALVEAVNLAPEHLARALAAGEMLADAGCANEAEQIFRHVAREARRGLEASPQDVELRLLVATTCERQGAQAEAADHLAMALLVDVDHAVANRRLAVLLGQLGDARGSIRCWRRVLARTGRQDLEALALLGMALSNDEQHDEAIAVLKEVAGQRRVSAAHADLGMALLSARRMNEALAAFTRARELEPTSAQAHCGLGLVYQQLGRWWEAADAFRQAEQLAPDSPAGPANLAAVLQILGEHDQARAALQRAAALAPEDEEIRRALAQEAVPAPAGDEITRPVGGSSPAGSPVEGNLSSFPIADALVFLEGQGKSGVLSVSGPDGTAQLRFIRGKVVSASASWMKSMPDMLLEHRLVRPPDLRVALAAQNDDREDRLGTLLVRKGSIAPAQLAAVVWRQILVATKPILSWPDGSFSFEEAAPEDPPATSFTTGQIQASLAKRREPHSRAIVSPGQ